MSLAEPTREVSALRDRLAWVGRLRRVVAGNIDSLIRSIEQEVDKGRFEALTSEVVPLLASCRWHEGHARRVLRRRRLRGASIWQVGQRHAVERVPLGRVGIIATWNYPLQLLGIQMVQAVVGGNDVVIKPSERSPETQRLLFELARDARPPVEIELLSPDREAGARMLDEFRLDHVVFTGSTGVGRQVASRLSRDLTPSTLELSGCDSAIVLEDADIRLAAKSLWYALSLNAGRTCMAPRRVIAVGAAFDALTSQLESRACEVPPGRAEIDAETRSLVDDAAAGGGRVLDLGGDAVRVVAEPPRDGRLFAGDHFGGASSIVKARDLEEALAIHSGIDQKLATSIFSRDTRVAVKLATRLGSTTVTINDAIIPTGHPASSIGGIGPSGWGVSRGEAGLVAMTRPVFVSTTSSRVRTPLDPPPEGQARQIESFVKWWYGGR